MDITRDIQSLSEFKQNASKFVKQVQETREPVVLTVNGKAAVVIQDAESYQEMVGFQERAKLAALLSKRIRDIDEGVSMRTAEEFFAEFSEKYDVSFEDDSEPEG